MSSNFISRPRASDAAVASSLPAAVMGPGRRQQVIVFSFLVSG